MRGTLFGAAVLVPLSVLFSGLTTHYVGGMLGLTLNLICLFFNGLGVSIMLDRVSHLAELIMCKVDFVLSPSASYAVDVMHTRSAESTAANA